MKRRDRLMSSGWGRREFLGLLAASALGGKARAAVAPRLAAIDWAMLETSVALGIMPVAATELIQFRAGAVEPEIPETVSDLGLRGAPNFELLQLTRPDLILISPFYTRYTGRLEAIAPVFSLPFYVKGEPPFEKSLAAVSALGEKLGRADEARKVLDEAHLALQAMRTRLAGFASRPTHVINIGDARHFRAFGEDSMFGDILGRLGLTNAWVDRSQFTFAAPVPLENLADVADARIVIVSDVPVEARESLRNSAIWRALPAVRENRVVTLGNVSPYGGITAAMRFARLLTEALATHGEAL
ncbi:iron-siderophore ABC transporter substrate-binding protein [Agrobacterium tumefaciens]|uniref:Iron-siderophore ABC transporter substrate-binding protein n=1 Tax=Agrobacterium tumefaciens TaxID=358 RepID=A0AA44F6N0_AGRTU|nr:iron-siderophore ABC transporter substrate-binding protein [Agrobacterium tumefaciens]NSL24214.1 iron-siderophore ABC transporter substrate-binding protein [Agrobacterium tumefaciens]NTB89117.1 iron-siderophore ABC transporter substrate-binding protein [Agrobacterium tumefaciens]NTC15968.1 iron-siderophore ABC transporter substrate-binding protein [Agrobacterium tumefaciens]NTC29549.1 iron-siderophore ABC transporter substrate-binding protein [Agrobacterium tumefaciens]NTC54544.1 iron-sider